MRKNARGSLRIWFGVFITKDESPQFVAQSLDLLGIVGCAELLGEIEECLFFLPAGFDAFFDELDEDAVVA